MLHQNGFHGDTSRTPMHAVTTVAAAVRQVAAVVPISIWLVFCLGVL